MLNFLFFHTTLALFRRRVESALVVSVLVLVVACIFTRSFYRDDAFHSNKRRYWSLRGLMEKVERLVWAPKKHRIFLDMFERSSTEKLKSWNFFDEIFGLLLKKKYIKRDGGLVRGHQWINWCYHCLYSHPYARCQLLQCHNFFPLSLSLFVQPSLCSTFFYILTCFAWHGGKIKILISLL